MKTIWRQWAGLIARALLLGMAASAAMACELVVDNWRADYGPLIPALDQPRLRCVGLW